MNYGVMGLSREFISTSTSSGPLYLNELRRTGSLKTGVFAILIGMQGNQSCIEIGGYGEIVSTPVLNPQLQNQIGLLIPPVKATNSTQSAPRNL